MASALVVIGSNLLVALPARAPPPHEIRIACLGDSLTHAHLSGAISYVPLLGKLLQPMASNAAARMNASAPRIAMGNWGLGGRMASHFSGEGHCAKRSFRHHETESAYHFMQRSTSFRPDVVVLLFGYNDAWHATLGCWDPQVFTDGLYDIAAAFFNRSSAPPAVVLALPPPIVPKPPANATRADAKSVHRAATQLWSQMAQANASNLLEWSALPPMPPAPGMPPPAPPRAASLDMTGSSFANVSDDAARPSVAATNARLLNALPPLVREAGRRLRMLSSPATAENPPSGPCAPGSVRVLDLHAAVEASGCGGACFSRTIDGVHPSELGAMLFAQAFAKELGPCVSPNSR